MKRLHTLPLAFASALILLAGQAGAATLAERWSTLRSEQPKVMIRDAARTLGVSEADLLATGIGSTVIRLRSDGDDPREIMRRALDLGTVLALTRNENGVIERTGVATRVKPKAESTVDPAKETDPERLARLRNIAGGYLGGDIDLRFTFAKWKYAFAVAPLGADGAVKRSLQFFDANGAAVHKIYPKDAASVAVFEMQRGPGL